MTKDKMIELINSTNDNNVLEKIAKQPNVTYKILEKIVSKTDDRNVLLAVVNNKIADPALRETVLIKTDDEIVLFRIEELTYEYIDNVSISKMNKEERKNYTKTKPSISGAEFKKFVLFLNPSLKLNKAK